MRSSASGRVERIVPDGRPEIILNLGAPFRRTLAGGGVREQDACLVVGQLRESLLTAPSGCVDLFGIRFQPAGLRAIPGCSVRELVDADVSLGDISARVRDMFVDAVRLAPRGERVARVDRLLCELIGVRRGASASRYALASEAARCVDRMCSPTVGELAETLGVSGRSIERAFASEIGVGPKEYIRIQRLQRVVRAINGARSRPDWAGLAATHGYFDQAHLVREFRLIAGLTPEAYYRENSVIAGAFTGA